MYLCFDYVYDKNDSPKNVHMDQNMYVCPTLFNDLPSELKQIISSSDLILY